jgi:hypothetical protein
MCGSNNFSAFITKQNWQTIGGQIAQTFPLTELTTASASIPDSRTSTSTTILP